VYTVAPLGVPSLVHAVEPPNASKTLLPERTAEKEVKETPLPQVKAPPETPQFPFEEVKVKLLVDPESVYVARVCVDHVPRDRSPPTSEPDCRAFMVALVGRVPGVLVSEGDVVVVVEPPPLVVVTGVPVLGGYLIPLDGQEPPEGALIGTKTPSMAEPFKLKYQEIAPSEPDVQSSAGVTPAADLRADVRAERVYVLEESGVIPALASQVYVGRLLKSLTTVWK